MLQMVILAGGMATRLASLGRRIPKSLMPVGGRPFLDIQLEWMHAQGVGRVLILAGYLGEMLEEHVARHCPPGMDIAFSHDPQDALLGTGGALKWAEALLDDDFFLIYGDSYLPLELEPVREFYLRQGRNPVQVVYRNLDAYDRSNMDIAGGKVIYYQKKPDRKVEYIDYGLSVLNKSVLARYSRGEKFDLSEITHHLIAGGSLLAWETKTRFWEIGTVSGLQELEQYLSGKEN